MSEKPTHLKAPCPCHSGKPFKDCCGRSSLAYHVGSIVLPAHNCKLQIQRHKDAWSVQVGQVICGGRPSPIWVTIDHTKLFLIDKSLKLYTYNGKIETPKSCLQSLYGSDIPFKGKATTHVDEIFVHPNWLCAPAPGWRTPLDFLLDFVDIHNGLVPSHPLRQIAESIRKSKQGLEVFTRTGELDYFASTVYNWVLAMNNGLMTPVLLHRLSHPDQFQGARLELMLIGASARGQFALEFEDETEGSKRHAEFSMTIDAVKYSIEAKSRHRAGYLGRPGVMDNGMSGLLALLNDAEDKRKPNLITVVDVNGFMQDEDTLTNDWVITLQPKLQEWIKTVQYTSIIVAVNHGEHRYISNAVNKDTALIIKHPSSRMPDAAIVKLKAAVDSAGEWPTSFNIQVQRFL